MSGRLKWTPAMLETLRQCYPDNRIPLGETAARLGVTEIAAMHKANRIGLHRRTRWHRLLRYTEEQFEYVRRHYPDLSNKIIALVSGVSRETVNRWGKMYGWRKSDRYIAESFCPKYMPRWRWQKMRNPEKYREKRRAEQLRYRETHREQVRERQRRYRAANRERLKELARCYRETHRDVIKAYERRRRLERKLLGQTKQETPNQ